MTLKLYALSFACLLLSCSREPTDEGALAGADTTAIANEVVVRTVPVRAASFPAQLVTNGRILTAHEAALSFKAGGVIARILVSNGATVKAGDLLAELENDAQQLALKQAHLQLRESRVEIDDQLLTQGGKRGDSASVRPEVYSYIRLRSGYERALLEVEKARLTLENTRLRAPINGTIADLALNTFVSIPADKPFCSIINRSEIILRCPVLETELSMVAPGQAALIYPVGLQSTAFAGQVAGVNPRVSTQGQSEVTIRLSAPDKRLFTGMNARVVIEKHFPPRLVVPKVAVLERNGRKVVFVHEKGVAKWHYITTGMENESSVEVTEGLEEGQEVIISGHLNLGHDARVRETEQ